VPGTPLKAVARSAQLTDSAQRRLTIRYALPEAAHVALQVYDVTGRRVAVLVRGEQAAGAHHALFDATTLASGLYLYRLEASGQALTGTMLPMR